MKEHWEQRVKRLKVSGAKIEDRNFIGGDFHLEVAIVFLIL